jgi:hypothetical protein
MAALNRAQSLVALEPALVHLVAWGPANKNSLYISLQNADMCDSRQLEPCFSSLVPVEIRSNQCARLKFMRHLTGQHVDQLAEQCHMQLQRATLIVRLSQP